MSFSSSLSNGMVNVGFGLMGQGRLRRSMIVQSKIREIFKPALSSTMTEGKIVSWIKSEGDVLSKGESVVVVESDKVEMDMETFYDGILVAIVVYEGQTAPVGAPIGLLAESEEEVAEAKAKTPASSGGGSAPPQPNSAPVAVVSEPVVAEPTPKASPAAVDGTKKIVATPYAKKLAKQHKVDINSLVGTGPFRRITPEDVEAAAGITPKKSVFVAPPPQAAPSVAPKAAASAALPLLPGSTIVPFTTMQSAVSKNMLESLSVPLSVWGIQCQRMHWTNCMRRLLPWLALAQHPVVNASCKDGKSFTYNSSINIVVAVAINGGLITPVLRDADKLDLYMLSQKWKELVEKARSKQLQPHEYNSGTFTLSNLGMFGVDRFDAILPPGQGVIMAVGASKPTVVTGADGFFSVKSKMLVNVTADHRIIYGAFLQTFSKIVESPDSLTL